MAVTNYKISILNYKDCPIRYDDPKKVLDILKCWRKNNVTSKTCLKCLKDLSFDLNFTICCGQFYFKPTNDYIIQSIAIYTPRHSFLPKHLKDQLKKLKIKYNQNFIVLPDPIYWLISSTLVYELALKKITGYVVKKRVVRKKRKRDEEDAYIFNKLNTAFLNHGSLNRRSEGKNTYYRKIALAKRSELTVRAMIVPAPFLNPNEIIIPESMEKELNLKGKWLILNRMPSLLPENYIALRVKDSWPHDCFGIPLEITKCLNADFDGDEFSGLVIYSYQSQAECETILNSKENIHSFTMGLKLNPSYDMLVVYYLKYDEIDFLPYKNKDLYKTLLVIYELYGSRQCFDCIVKLKNYYLEVMQNKILYCISLEEISELEKLCQTLNFEEFEKTMENCKEGCLKTQIAANPERSFYQLYQNLGSLGLQCSKNNPITTIKSSFSKGLSPVELVNHAIFGIDSLIFAHGVSFQGYMYFKLINNLHPWIVNYKGELVDGKTVVEEDVLNMFHPEDAISKASFKELINQYLIKKTMLLKQNRNLFSSNSSTSSYETDDSGCEKYPKWKNQEFYLYDNNKMPIFAKNSDNDEVYAKDEFMNEIYPLRAPFFARNRYNDVYYAKDKEGNEFYPLFRGLNIYTFNKDGNVLIARYKSGKQRYPSDCFGNAYYPRNRNGEPFYLTDENGLKYPAKTKKNENIYLEPPILDKKHVKKRKDAFKNTVYMSHPKIYNWRVSLSVVCYLILISSPLVLISTLLI